MCLCGSFSLLLSGGLRGAVRQTDSSAGECTDSAISAGTCLGGFDRRKTYIDTVRNSNSVTFVADYGELVGLGSFWRFFKGSAHRSLLETLGYDVITVAKSDLFLGPDVFANIANNAVYTTVNANVDFTKTALATQRYKILEKLGVKIGITALFDPVRTSQTNMGAAVMKNLYASVGRAIGEMNNLGCSFVVVFASNFVMSSMIDLATQIPEIDLIVGGKESAESVSTVVGTTHIRICNNCENGYSMLRLDVETDGLTITSLSHTETLLDKSIKSDAGVTAQLKAYNDLIVADQRNNVFGYMGETAIGDRTICRFKSCSVGNFITKILANSTNSEIALINAGAIRANFTTGPISLQSILSVLPFSDDISTCRLRGGDLVKTLEYGLGGIITGLLQGRFVQAHGVKIHYNSNSTIVTNVTVYNPATGELDAPIDLLKEYTVATVTFLRQGGDGQTTIQNKAIDPKDFGPSLKDKIAEFFRGTANVPQVASIEQRYLPHLSSNLSVLSICPAGYEIAGDFGCLPCPKGKFRNPSGLLDTDQKCKDCLDGYYADSTGAVQCTKCPANARTYIPGAVSLDACQCEKLFLGVNGGECTPCPRGGVCPGGTNISLVADGYFRSPVNPNLFRQCYPPEACKGGAEAMCSEEYDGLNCGRCAEGFYRRNGGCNKCHNPDNVLAFVGFILGFLFLVLIVYISVLYSSSDSRRRRSYIGITVFILQILSLFRNFYPGVWPRSLESLLDLIALTNVSLDLFSFECVWKATPFSKWLIAMCLPGMFLVILGLYIGIAGIALVVTTDSSAVKRSSSQSNTLAATNSNPRTVASRMRASVSVQFARSRSQPSTAVGEDGAENGEAAATQKHLTPSDMWHRIILTGKASFGNFIIFAYVYLTSTALSVFDCSREDDHSSFMLIDPSLTCWHGSKFATWAAIASPFILFYSIGIPAYVAYRIFRATRPEATEDDKYLAFSYTDEFKPERAYWTISLLLWRLVFILVRVFIPYTWHLRGVLGVMLLLALVMMKVAWQAHKDKHTVALDLGATNALLLLYFFGLSLQFVVSFNAETIIVKTLFWFTLVVLVAGMIGLIGWVLLGKRILRMMGRGEKTTPASASELDALVRAKYSSSNTFLADDNDYGLPPRKGTP